MKSSISASWWSQAACQNIPDEQKRWFYSGNRQQFRAKAICRNECPVRLQCLDRAMDLEARGLGVFDGKRFGVWGGLDGVERKRLSEQPG